MEGSLLFVGTYGEQLGHVKGKGEGVIKWVGLDAFDGETKKIMDGSSVGRIFADVENFSLVCHR